MKKTITIAMITVIALSMSAVGQNLIDNGDFEAGNAGFDSEYNYVSSTGPTALQPPLVYTVGTDPSLYHSAWGNFGDHATGTGNMMIVNGTSVEATEPEKLVWGQEVTLPACESQETGYTIYAGQNWEIGEVLVKSEEGQICVKFVLTDAVAIIEGWVITEVHVAVGDEPGDIPQKKGNPTPGKFPINESLDPGVFETDWYCLDYDWTEGESLIIAAHAKLERPELSHTETYNLCVNSGLDTDLAAGGDASIAWGEPYVWTGMQEDLTASADWIWDAQYVTSDVADNGGMVDFVQGFDITGTPTSGELKIAADNAFAWSLTGGTETSENLADDWRAQALLGNFDTPPYATDPVVVLDPNPSGWRQVYTYNVLGELLSGTNLLNVTGVNADWNTTDPLTNPAGVIYTLCIDSEETIIDQTYDEETGWGGEGEFNGKNWAKYITYTPEACSASYLLEFYAASSYPDAPAQLQVTINGDVVGSTLEATSTVGEWVQYSESWNAGTDTSAIIEIRDLRYTFTGDDFVLDDISFMQQ